MYRHGGDVYRYKGVLDFSANINYLGMPQAVKEAAIRGVEESLHYPQPQNEALIAAISDRYGVPASDIVCGNGAAELIFALTQAIKPKRALVMAPSFSEYEQALDGCGCEVLRVLLHAEQAFRPDESFLCEITPSIDVVFVCNPNNPTGGLMPFSYMEKVLAACEGADALLVADESFMEFVQGAESMRRLLGTSKKLLVLQSFTKLYAMPGLRLGCCFCSDALLLERLRTQLQPWNVSLPAQYAGIAAMQELDFVQESVKKITIGREYVTGRLRLLPELSVYEGAANFLLFHGPEGLWQHCLEKGILLRDCSNFAGLGQGWYRMAIRSRQENERLLQVLADAKGECGNG